MAAGRILPTPSEIDLMPSIGALWCHGRRTMQRIRYEKTRKLCYRKDDRAMRLVYMSALKVFETP